MTGNSFSAFCFDKGHSYVLLAPKERGSKSNKIPRESQ